MLNPMISIVVPSFNAASTIARTLESLRRQNYPNLQVICVDAKSLDETVSIIENYQDIVSYLLVEPDKNIADGLNKGFRLASGELLGWLCADDELTEGALERFADAFARSPEAGLITGGCHRVFPNGLEFDTFPQTDFQRRLFLMNPIEQPSTLWRAEVHRAAGELDTSFDLAFDWEWWCRLAKRGVIFDKIESVQSVQSVYYFSEVNKTSQGGRKLVNEMYRGTRKYAPIFVGELYYILYLIFDLRGFYDYPNPRAPESMRLFGLLLTFLGKLFSAEIVNAYNWNFASKQERGLVWYAENHRPIVRPWWERGVIKAFALARRGKVRLLSAPPADQIIVECSSDNTGHWTESTARQTILDLEKRIENLDEELARRSSAFGLFPALFGLKQRGFEPNVVLDGGAAVGHWTTQVQSIWPMSRFSMVEALEERRSALDSVSSSLTCETDVFIGGLADINGELEFTVTDFLFDSSFAYDGGKARRVRVYRLDDLVHDGILPQPDLIKLDVQGFELTVLKGAENVLKKTACVLLECNFLKFSDQMPDLTDVIHRMDSYGFMPYEFVDFLRRPLDGAMGQCDILFVRRDHFLVKDRRWADLEN
jgi:FkbM family methyltransferase